MRIRPGMDGIPQSARTAIWGMLFCSFIAALPVHAEPACPQPAFDETTSVRSIHDGDTLTLKDGRKVRLIGINTPELSRDNKPAEPFAVAAREALKSLLSNSSTISLVYGKDKADRYGRLLAHIYTAEGENVQQDLLSQGMASAIVIPPNTTYAACYLAAEKTARCQHRGIWNDKTIVQAKELNKGHTGFHMIRGQVRSIDDNAKGIWLNLDDRLTVGIRPANQALFDKRQLNKLLHQSIIVRGWINHRASSNSKHSNPFYLRVRHPYAIQLADELTCDTSSALLQINGQLPDHLETIH